MCGVTPSRGWHPSENNKSDIDEQKKGRQFFRRKYTAVTPGELGGGDDYKKVASFFFQEKNRGDTLSCRSG